VLGERAPSDVTNSPEQRVCGYFDLLAVMVSQLTVGTATTGDRCAPSGASVISSASFDCLNAIWIRVMNVAVPQCIGTDRESCGDVECVWVTAQYRWAREIAFANTDAGRFSTRSTRKAISSNPVLVKSESNNSGRLNLTIRFPAAQVL
jgi:hypothetical protein